MENQTPRVSVRIVTYNHAGYISKAIESALEQETNFPFEIVIGEDFSTDGTREIVQTYHRDHPDIIRVNYHEENKGREFNFYNSLNSCRGEYVAMLDGDDYWISKDKLQIQYDFLEAHPEYVLCFNDCLHIRESGLKPPKVKSYPKNVYTKHDILRESFVAPSSAVLRNNLVKDIPEVFSKLPYCDWPYYYLLIQHGDMYCINETFTAYRQHHEGVWYGLAKEKKLKANLAFYEALLEVEEEDTEFVRQEIVKRKKMIADYHRKRWMAIFGRVPARVARRVRQVFGS